MLRNKNFIINCSVKASLLQFFNHLNLKFTMARENINDKFEQIHENLFTRKSINYEIFTDYSKWSKVFNETTHNLFKIKREKNWKN